MDHWCPRYSRFHENINHVFQCSQAPSTHKSAWAQFLSTLQKTSTCPLIVETLGYGISHWSTGSLPQWQGPNPGPTDNFRLLVLTAFQEEQSIGWDQAIRDHLSVHWEKENTLYCQEQLHQFGSHILYIVLYIMTSCTNVNTKCVSCSVKLISTDSVCGGCTRGSSWYSHPRATRIELFESADDMKPYARLRYIKARSCHVKLVCNTSVSRV